MISQYLGLIDVENTVVECEESQRGEGFVNELSGQFRLRVPGWARTYSNNYWVKIRGPGAILTLVTAAQRHLHLQRLVTPEY